MIETAATKDKRLAAEIFLDEWGTMGRKRPTVGILINLLVKTELFRAADYLAVDVLNGERPARPNVGPAATIELPEDIVISKLNRQIHNFAINSNFFLNSTVEAHSENPLTMPINSTNDIGVIEINYTEQINYNKTDKPQQTYEPHNITNLIKFSSDNLTDVKNINTKQNLMEFSGNSVKNISYGVEHSLSVLPDFRELKSSELPLCLNDAITTNNSTDELNSTVSSTTDYSNSSDTTTNDTTDISINSSELPLTVREFCN